MDAGNGRSVTPYLILPGSRPLGEQKRRQPAPRVDRYGILGPPSLKQLHELLAGGLVIPFALAAHELEQKLDRLGFLAAGG